MTAQPGTGRRSRLRLAAAVACSLAVAAGGVLAAAPAQAAASSSPCAGTTADLVGVVAPASGLSADLLDCAALLQLGQAPAEPTAPTIADVPTGAPESTEVPVLTDGGTAGVAEPDPTGRPTISTASASGAVPAPEPVDLRIRRSSSTVFPAKDGYLDVVRFSVRETAADGTAIPFAGDAVLTRAGRTIRTWHLHGLSDVIAWDGRVGRAIRPGLYTLRVTLTAPDGTVRTATSRVRVKAQRLERRAMMIRTDVGAKSVAAELPKQLLHAYRLGTVQVATRTVAVVRGPAKLVFTGEGRRKVVPLRNGVHTTRPVVLPPGFERITITHSWPKGAARLQSLQAIWTYWTLV